MCTRVFNLSRFRRKRLRGKGHLFFLRRLFFCKCINLSNQFLYLTRRSFFLNFLRNNHDHFFFNNNSLFLYHLGNKIRNFFDNRRRGARARNFRMRRFLYQIREEP